jgi:hypothetical protein
LWETDAVKKFGKTETIGREKASIFISSLSALLATTITSFTLLSLIIFKIFSSKSVNLSYSKSHIKISLSSIDSFVLSTISFAISSVLLEKSSHPLSDKI